MKLLTDVKAVAQERFWFQSHMTLAVKVVLAVIAVCFCMNLAWAEPQQKKSTMEKIQKKESNGKFRSSLKERSQEVQRKMLLPKQTEKPTRRIIIEAKENTPQKTVSKILKSENLKHIKTLKGVGYVCEAKGDNPLKEVIRSLKKSGLVAQKDSRHRLSALPNDPLFSMLWGLHNSGQTGGTPDADIDAPEAWNSETGDPSGVIAVIDSGVDIGHEDLADNIWINPGEGSTPDGIDNDNNGYIDDIHGINCITPPTGSGLPLDAGDPRDDNGHGTHVAGTIGAVGNNNTGVTGVNWDTKIMVLKAFDSDGYGNESDIIQCMQYVRKMKTDYGIDVKLINGSFGADTPNAALYDEIKALGNEGILGVFSAGNQKLDTDKRPHYPSGYNLSNIIAVAASSHDDELAEFLWFPFSLWSGSNYGRTTVDIAAPGKDIVSTFPDYVPINLDGLKYASFDGTSMAAPHVTGAASLLWAHYPDHQFSDVKEALLHTVDLLPSFESLVVSGGRLNIEKALNCEPTAPHVASSLPEGFTKEQSVSVVLNAQLSEGCSLVRGAQITASVSNEGENLIFRDDGVEPDPIANDGVHTVLWTPLQTDSVTITLNAEHEGSLYSTDINGEVVRYLTATPDSVKPGDVITAQWENLPPLPPDLNSLALYLYKENDQDPYAYLAWQYIEYSSHGSETFTLPQWLPSGRYQLIIGDFVFIDEGEGFERLATSNVFTAQGATLTVNPQEIQAGESFTVNWQDVKVSTPARLAYYRAGDDNPFSDIDFRDTNGEPDGSMTFNVPPYITEGTYVVRMWADRWHFKDLIAQSEPFTITSEVTVTVDPMVAEPGQMINVSWDSPVFTTWIGLFTPQGQWYDYLAYTYTRFSSSGTKPLTIPDGLQPGMYEVRLYQGSSTLLGISLPIEVAAPQQ